VRALICTVFQRSEHMKGAGRDSSLNDTFLITLGLDMSFIASSCWAGRHGIVIAGGAGVSLSWYCRM
jgi:hypothetical protein